MAANLKKKHRAGTIELDPIEPFLLVNFEAQLVNVDTNEVVESKPGKKKVKLKSFNPASPIDKVAAAVVAQCKYIHESKIPRVKKLLEQLKQRLLGPSADQVKAEVVQDMAQIEAKKKQAAAQLLQEQRAVKKQAEREAAAQLARETAARREAEELARRAQSDADRMAREQESRIKAQEARELAEAEAEIKALQERERLARENKKAEAARKKAKKPPKHWRGATEDALKAPTSEKAKMSNLELYIEALYEQKADKMVKGTYLILQLVHDPYNLAKFVDNERLLNALSRVLIEERKKSTELVTYILEIFFSFSTYLSLHPILLTAKIGNTCIKVLELEGKRYTKRMEEEAKAERAEKKKKSRSGKVSSATKEREIELAKFLARQEKLVYVCLYILLNLSEDVQIEMKMRNKNIVALLCGCLHRENRDRHLLDELHILVVTFLKKMSIFKENKDRMIESGLLTVLTQHFIPPVSGHQDLGLATLRLIYNLSFDPQVRVTCLEVDGLVTSLVNQVDNKTSKAVAIRILYNLSMDQQVRKQLAVSGVVSVIGRLVVSSESRLVEKELIALAINLAATQRGAEDFTKTHNNEDQLGLLIKRCHQVNDPFLGKLLRNIAAFASEAVQRRFERHLHEMVGMALTPGASPDFVVEILGTLGVLQFPHFHYKELLSRHQLGEFLVKQLVPDFAEDDMCVAVFVLFATLSLDPNSAPQIARRCHNLPNFMHQLLQDKGDDSELVLQLVYCVCELCGHDATRDLVCESAPLVNSLVEMMHDPNTTIRRWVNQALDRIAETGDEQYLDVIREKRFQMNNPEWIDAVERLPEDFDATSFQNSYEQADDSLGLDYSAGLYGQDPAHAADSKPMFYQDDDPHFMDEMSGSSDEDY